jgi:hypothetical protein
MTRGERRGHRTGLRDHRREMLPSKGAGFDPATASAPFVAMLVDVTGLVIYFSVAYVVLRGTLL